MLPTPEKPIRRILPYFEAPAEFRPYDPEAAVVAQALARLIQTADPLLHVEHVGSTAVPGCGGKGIIDLAVLYPSGGLARARAVLDGLGFQRQTGADPFPESRPMRVGAVLGANHRFRIHAHVLARAAAEFQELLEFRDRLRRDEKLRQAYLESKRAILARGITVPLEYCRAKGEFIAAQLQTQPPADGRV